MSSVLFGQLLFMVVIAISFGVHVEPSTLTNCSATKCVFNVTNQSLKYFHSRLVEEDPKLVKFHIKLDTDKSIYFAPETFEPLQWVWTYNSSRGMYPYLYWNIDFGLLSFGLLEAKTLREHMFVYMRVHSRNKTRSEDCNITFGSRDTTDAIVCALTGLNTQFNKQEPKYQNSYYCYLAEKPGVRDTMGYVAAQYLLYPVEFINYNCCYTGYNYTGQKSFSACMKYQVRKWPQCTIAPYVLGIVILLYFPILILRVGEGLSNNMPVIQEYELIGGDNGNMSCTSAMDSDWIFLTDKTPYGILDVLSHFWCGLDKTHPILVSRIKRLLFVIFAPTLVYVQLFMYGYSWEPGLLQKLVHHGTPLGFLTMLGHSDDRHKYFVPVFGGGLGILISYGIIGLIIVVVPRNLKQLLEDGIPKGSNTTTSPLFLGVYEIRYLSTKQVDSGPGYGSCADICVCGIYLIFSEDFWMRAFAIQKHRLLSCLGQLCHRRATVCFLVLIFPLYITFCLFEVLACVVWYGIPFIRFVTFLVRGTYVSFVNSEGRPNCIRSAMRNPIFLVLGMTVLVGVYIFFVYTFSLIFIQSFVYMCNVLMFCLVAVIIYPAISFGYLFFFIMLLYYIFHMMRGFGDTYLMLLSEAVDVSRDLDGEINHTTVCGSTLQVSNIRAQNITQIKLENMIVSIPQNLFQTLVNESNRQPKVKAKNNTYGIPKNLFDKLIHKYKPANQQILKILFQLVLIITLLILTMSIAGGFVTGPASEISDVMHVIFIVAIGALPRILEIAFSSAHESVHREIQMRLYEQTIVRYWQRKEMENFA